jgi:hypothetical protein
VRGLNWAGIFKKRLVHAGKSTTETVKAGGHRATFDTKKEADNALTNIKSRIGKGEYIASKLLPKFRELAEDWFRSKCDRRPGTVGNWRAQIDLHLNPKLGDLRLDRIDVVLIESCATNFVQN